jgi:branched-chain amino acid aminotransferase
MDEASIWLDGELVPWSEANVHVTSYGLTFGIGIFEAVRCWETSEGPAFFRPRLHLRRLRDTARTYMVPLEMSDDDYLTACKEVLRACDLPEGHLRILMFMGEGESPAAASYRTAIIGTRGTVALQPDDKDGAHAKISNVERLSVAGIPPGAKSTGQYVGSYLAQLDAMFAGADHALLMSPSGHVVDGWVHNLFVVREGVLYTPPLSAGILRGTTRATVIDLAADLDVRVVEDNLTRTDVYGADEAFITGTLQGITPLASVDSREIADGTAGEVTRRVLDAFDDVVHGRSGAHPEWRESAELDAEPEAQPEAVPAEVGA